jgi:elongation factor P
MIAAAELKPGMALRLEGNIYKVIAAEFKAGAGQLGGVVKTKLKNISNGRFLEPHFRPDERLEDLELERKTMEMLFGDAETVTFMNAETYEQAEIPRAVAGPAGKFLMPGMTLAVEFFEGQPVNLIFPPVAEVRIADTAPAVHAQHDSTWKQAKLENGAVIMVPLFIEKGETVHVDVQSEQYVDRVRLVHKRGA